MKLMLKVGMVLQAVVEVDATMEKDTAAYLFGNMDLAKADLAYDIVPVDENDVFPKHAVEQLAHLGGRAMLSEYLKRVKELDKEFGVERVVAVQPSDDGVKH